MIITTTYTERLTITTDDAGNVTTTRTSHADTVSAYWFTELDPEAQARAIRDAIEEDQEDYYSSHAYLEECEIVDAARDLERQQPISIRQDAGCSWYGEPRAHGWSEPYEEVTEATDNGICWSMDMCDAWNQYAPRIMALCEAIEEAADMSGELFDVAQDVNRAWYDAETDADRARLAAIEETAREGYQQADRIIEACTCAADELTREAAQAVGAVVDGLIDAQNDYYTSTEFWLEWLSDGDERYTRDGARI